VSIGTGSSSMHPCRGSQLLSFLPFASPSGSSLCFCAAAADLEAEQALADANMAALLEEEET